MTSQLLAGFSVAHTVNEVFVPSKVDLETGEVENSLHEVHFFRYHCSSAAILYVTVSSELLRFVNSVKCKMNRTVV